jgi:glycosyltransferase involved in cell wall biosynthesis
MKVAINTIAKNEAHRVADWLAHGADADYLVVLDTGSTDDTVKLLEEGGAIVGHKEITPWRFDVARNEALKLVPEDADVVIAVDLDERIQPGWREALEREWEPDTDLMNYWLHDKFRDKEMTMPTVEDNRLKIFRRHGIEWVRWVHEVPRRIDGEGANVKVCRDIVIKHLQLANAPSRDYTGILTDWINANPDGEDQIEALPERADEYSKKGEWYLALQDLEMFIRKSFNPKCDMQRDIRCQQVAGQRAVAYLNIAQCKHQMGWAPEVVLQSLLHAVAECPAMREPWVFLADGAKGVGNHALAYGSAKTALSITDNGIYTKNVTVWGDLPEKMSREALVEILKTKI